MIHLKLSIGALLTLATLVASANQIRTLNLEPVQVASSYFTNLEGSKEYINQCERTAAWLNRDISYYQDEKYFVLRASCEGKFEEWYPSTLTLKTPIKTNLSKQAITRLGCFSSQEDLSDMQRLFSLLSNQDVQIYLTEHETTSCPQDAAIGVKLTIRVN